MKSLIRGCGSAWRGAPEKAPCHLVIFYKQLGDTVLLEPTLDKLAAQTGERVLLYTKPEVRAVVDLMPHVQAVEDTSRVKCRNIWVYERGSKPAFRAWRTVAGHKHLRLRQPLNLRSYHPWIFDDIAFTPSVDTYAARFYWNTTPEAGMQVFRSPRLLNPPDEWRSGIELPEEYILINPVAGTSRKCWPAEKWSAALSAIAERTGMPLVVTGQKSDWSSRHIQEIGTLVRFPMIDLTGKTNLRQYMFVISRAGLVLTVDGACSHLAQAFGRRTITLFTATNTANPCSWSYPREGSAVLCERPHSAAEFNGSPRPPEYLVELVDDLPAMPQPLHRVELHEP